MPSSPCANWSQQISRYSETGMNSQSHTTLAVPEDSMSCDGALGLREISESSGYWPFVFDSSYQETSQKESSSDAIAQSQSHCVLDSSVPPNDGKKNKTKHNNF